MKCLHNKNESKCKVCKRYNTCGVCGNKYLKSLYCITCTYIRHHVIQRVKKIPDGTFKEIRLDLDL